MFPPSPYVRTPACLSSSQVSPPQRHCALPLQKRLPPSQNQTTNKESAEALSLFAFAVQFFQFPHSTCSHRRMRMVAAWARTALPPGFRVVAVTPVISPWPLAQAMACLA